MHILKQATLVTALLLAAFIMTGCASGNRADSPHDFQTEIAQVDLDAIPIFNGATGERKTWDELVAASANADIVLIGEMHGHPVGLAIAALLYEQAATRNPDTAALSLEFFNRDKQWALDDYLAELTDEEGFRKAARLKPGNYPAGHRAMVETARRLNQPVIASNAPRQYTGVARKEGYDRLRELTEEQRRLFAIPDKLTEGRYRESFFDLMSGMVGHGKSDDSEAEDERTPEEIAEAEAELQEKVLGFFRSQNLWDATMAHAIVRAVAAGRAPIFHVVGYFHVASEGGLTLRLKEILPSANIIVITMTSEDGEELAEDEAGSADWIIHVGPHE